jgi:hypothetical protein
VAAFRRRHRRRLSGTQRLFRAFSLAEQVDAQVPGDGDDPAAKLRAVAELADSFEAFEQGVLGDILGICTLPRMPRQTRKTWL